MAAPTSARTLCPPIATRRCPRPKYRPPPAADLKRRSAIGRAGLAPQPRAGYDRAWSEPCLREPSARQSPRRPLEMVDSAAHAGWLGRVSALSSHRYAPWLLGAIAFADSSFLPIPPDLLLVPMILLLPERLWWLLAICTVGSTLGAAVGYLIGYFLWQTLGAPLVEFYGQMDHYLIFKD